MSCVKRIKDSLEELDGVTSTEVDLNDEKAEVTFDSDKVTIEELVSTVNDAGYQASIKE
jgi:copper chaperone CopZ